MLSMANEWLFEADSRGADGTRPSATQGTAVTPAQNAYGSYASLGVLSATYDTYEIEIHVAVVGISASARNGLVTIGIDPAGGTSYTDVISDLLVGPAGAIAAGSGMNGWVTFKFPLRIKAGSSIAAKASVNSATLNDIRVWAIVRGRPSRPELIRWGTIVDTFGATTATSEGTTITPGTVSDGAWTQIGSALAQPYFFWEFGYGVNDASMQIAAVYVDIGLGDATNKRLIISNASVLCAASEQIHKNMEGRFAMGATGDLVYARAQTSGTVDDNVSIAVYGVR